MKLIYNKKFPKEGTPFIAKMKGYPWPTLAVYNSLTSQIVWSYKHAEGQDVGDEFYDVWFENQYDSPDRLEAWCELKTDDSFECLKTLLIHDFPFNGFISDVNENSPIYNPKHYNSHPSGIEVIKLARHMNFNLGNALKYILRCDYKCDAIEDLKKAIWYIEDEIKKREEQDGNN